MEPKKKHISYRHPADELNEGIRFDEQLKAKKEQKEKAINFLKSKKKKENHK